jgi:hypothetical protein
MQNAESGLGDVTRAAHITRDLLAVSVSSVVLPGTAITPFRPNKNPPRSGAKGIAVPPNLTRHLTMACHLIGS